MFPIVLNVYSGMTSAKMLGKSGGKQNLSLINNPIKMKLSFSPRQCHLGSQLLLYITAIRGRLTKQIQGHIGSPIILCQIMILCQDFFVFLILPFFKFYFTFAYSSFVYTLWSLFLCYYENPERVIEWISVSIPISCAVFHVLFLLFVLTYFIFWCCLLAYLFCLPILWLSLQRLFVF